MMMLHATMSARPTTVATKQTAARMPTAGRVVAGRRVAMPAARCVSSSPLGVTCYLRPLQGAPTLG